MSTVNKRVTMAVRSRMRHSEANTVVEPTSTGVDVYLHGYLIARLDGDTVTLDTCGHHTPLTRDRMNAFLAGIKSAKRASLRAGEIVFVSMEHTA